MKCILFSIISLISLVAPVQGFQGDTTISSRVAFASPAEERIVSDFLDDENEDYVMLFLAVNSHKRYSDLQSIAKKIYLDIEKYDNEKFHKSSPKKKAKALFGGLHDQYFQKYVAGASLESTLDKGVYSCATASALFSVYFEKLGLPYEIKLMPGHVYLVLFPQSESIKIETTNPLSGIYVPDAKMKNQYVKYLLGSKIISEAEYGSNTTDELFDKYFYSETGIGIEEIPSILYFNFGVEALNKGSFEEAVPHFEKSLLFRQDEITQYLLYASLNNGILLSDFKTKEELDLLVKYNRIDVPVKNDELVIDVFKKLLYDVLFDQGNHAESIEIYNYLATNIQDTVIKGELDFSFGYDMGRYYGMKGDARKAAEYFALAFESNPKNVEVLALLNQSILNVVYEMGQTEKVIQYLNEQLAKYPRLAENKELTSRLMGLYLQSAYEFYSRSMPVEANEKLNEFEDLADKFGLEQVNDTFIAEVYSSATAYYFKRGSYSKAKSFLRRGLEYAPNHYMLLQLQNSF